MKLKIFSSIRREVTNTHGIMSKKETHEINVCECVSVDIISVDSKTKCVVMIRVYWYALSVRLSLSLFPPFSLATFLNLFSSMFSHFLCRINEKHNVVAVVVSQRIRKQCYRRRRHRSISTSRFMFLSKSRNISTQRTMKPVNDSLDTINVRHLLLHLLLIRRNLNCRHQKTNRTELNMLNTKHTHTHSHLSQSSFFFSRRI